MSNSKTLGTNDYFDAFIADDCNLSLNDYKVSANGYLSRKQVNQTIGYIFIPKGKK